MIYNKRYYIYILASKKNGTLYIGVTSNFTKRIQQHKEKFIDGFTKKYKVNILVYYEVYSDVGKALYREKQLKKWNREWKIRLINEQNQDWRDLYNEII